MALSDHTADDEKRMRDTLASQNIPTPDQAARKLAIASAMTEFTALHDTEEQTKTDFSQGFSHWLRLMIGTRTESWRNTMISSRKVMYSAIATVCVGVFVVNYNLDSVPELEPMVLSDAGDNKDKKRTLGDSRLATAAVPEAMEMDAAARSPDILGLIETKNNPVKTQPRPGARAGLEEVVVTSAIASRSKAYIDTELPAAVVPQQVNRDQFEAFEQNRVSLVSEQPVSTFSIDVDTASYSFVRRQLNSGVLPQVDAVRAEEMINYFSYDYPLPENRSQPFKPSVTVTDSPWAEGRKLLHIGIKGFDVDQTQQPRSNLVFLLDVSGSMNSPDKLPLVKQSMEMLLSALQPDDTVAIAVYAGAAGAVLEPTPVREKQTIIDALSRLQAGGSTAGGEGLRLAYQLAKSQFDEQAVNRVVLATDGDFNVGIANTRELQGFVERKRDQGIYLSVLGFGRGNYQDQRMQALAQNGNGVAAYIDTLGEAQKVLVHQATSTLFPIANDVKIQVDFNPARVAEYRLIGYETRQLKREDFNNDAVDAGDIGAGHTVTAIYEITPVGSANPQIEPSRYAEKPAQTLGSEAEYAFLKLRYKLPGEDQSQLLSLPITEVMSSDSSNTGTLARESQFATAVAGFAQILKGSTYTGSYSYDDVIDLAQTSKGDDLYGYRTEFIQLVRKAKTAAAMAVPR